MYLIAIDPGAHGGLAYCTNGKVCRLEAMPDTEGDILEALRSFKWLAEAEKQPVQAFVEKVGGFVKGVPAPGSAMFNFGRNAGFIIGCLQCLGYPLQEVPPQRWQKALGLPERQGRTTAEWKRFLKQQAQQRRPDLKITLETADALLIAEYALNSIPR